MTDTRVMLLLRHYRQRLGVSQERAAEMADLDHSLISRLESGRRTLTAYSLDAIARGWQLTPAERDQLALAAGLAPTDPLALLAGEPAVAALYRYLHDADVAALERQRVREIVQLLVATLAPAQTEQVA